MASIADLWCLKNVTIYNPMAPLGLLDDEADEEHILRLWGSDPDHPTDKAYEALAQHLRDTIKTIAAEQRIKNATASKTRANSCPRLPSGLPNPSEGSHG